MLVAGTRRSRSTNHVPNDADTGKLVAEGLGVEPCFVTPSWTEVTAGNWGDRWDLAYNWGAIDFGRMEVLYIPHRELSVLQLLRPQVPSADQGSFRIFARNGRTAR